MRPLRCDSRLLKRLPKFLGLTPGCYLRVVLCPTPRLARTFGAESILSIPRCTCPATFFVGMNDSVCTQYLCVALRRGRVGASARLLPDTRVL